MRWLMLLPMAALCTTACAAGILRTADSLGTAGRHDPAQLLQEADANGDGKITKAELTQARDRLFTRLDRNGDGYLTQDDFQRRLLSRRAGAGGDSGDRYAGMAAVLDKDGDGRISRTEFVNGPAKLFDRADTNHDGTVDAKELAALRASPAAQP
ncbi:MAG TPA: EF-hand domain-containing protein [Bordetella sp.]|nr:EF-hand domain-containing protein [Bordetella sp.]